MILLLSSSCSWSSTIALRGNYYYWYYYYHYYHYHHGQVPVRSDEAMDLVERAPGSQSDTVVDTEKMPESGVLKYKMENV